MMSKFIDEYGLRRDVEPYLFEKRASEKATVALRYGTGQSIYARLARIDLSFRNSTCSYRDTELKFVDQVD